MKKNERFAKKINDYLFDHRVLRFIIDNGKGLLFATLGAAIFAFGFSAFITPGHINGQTSLTIVTGGVSGLSQNLNLIFKLFNAPESITEHNLIQSIGYFAFNIPIILFAWFFIGKRFSILTAINVGLSSLFISLFSASDFIKEIQTNPIVYDSLLTRTLFGAVVIGISSAIAFKGDLSCGGIDVITYYFAMRKSTSVGKYSVALNGFIVSSYSILLLGLPGINPSDCILSLLFSISYLFISSMVVDAINLRNKKIQIQIITNNEYVADVLISNFPHGATVIDAKGVYTHAQRKIIYMIVSSSEVKRVVTLAKKVDPHAFIFATPLKQVYGNFFIKPVE